MRILTLARFYKEQEIELIESFEWNEYIFNPKDIITANESSDGYSTIELKGCERQTVAIDWEQMKSIIGETKEVMNSKAKYEYNEQ